MDQPIYKDKLGKATEVQAGFDDTLFLQAKSAITGRTAENTIIDHIGDKEAFFNMDAAGFQSCQDEMVEIVYNKELEQRKKIEDAHEFLDGEYNGDELYGEQLERQLDDFADELLDLVEDCDRVGHQVCSESLKRYLGAGSDATNQNS
jgi:hypothetical protein